jgi:hypothetical protein
MIAYFGEGGDGFAFFMMLLRGQRRRGFNFLFLFSILRSGIFNLMCFVSVLYLSCVGGAGKEGMERGRRDG